MSRGLLSGLPPCLSPLVIYLGKKKGQLIMLLKNNAKRLITITEPLDLVKDKDGKVQTATGGAIYNLMPAGEAISVPDVLCGSKFVKALIAIGDISSAEDTGSEGEDDEFEITKMTKSELVSFAEENKIEIDSSSKKALILETIIEAVGD